MNVTAMQTRLKARFRDPNQDIYTDAAWLGYINDAYQDVQAAVDHWPWMETRDASLSVAANTRSTTLPTDVFRVISVLNATDDIRMTAMEGTDQHIDLFPAEDETGPPSFYRIFGTTLEVYPLPTGTLALHVEYFKPAAELSAGSDVPAFPSQWHRILVEGALERAYIDDGNREQAQIHAEAFTGLLDALRGALLDARQSRYHEIVDTWYI